MKNLKLEEVKPENDNVLITIDLPNQDDGEIKLDTKLGKFSHTEMYSATAIKLGKDALSKESGCPDLEVGDKVIVNKFSGFNVATANEYSKIVRGYDIVAMQKEGKLIAANDRLLVEIIGEGIVEEEGIKVEKSFDPREHETQAGKIVHCGSNAIQYPLGTIVFFDPFSGSLIVNEPDKKLKTINSADILFYI